MTESPYVQRLPAPVVKLIGIVYTGVGVPVLTALVVAFPWVGYVRSETWGIGTRDVIGYGIGVAFSLLVLVIVLRAYWRVAFRGGTSVAPTVVVKAVPFLLLGGLALGVVFATHVIDRGIRTAVTVSKHHCADVLCRRGSLQCEAANPRFAACVEAAPACSRATSQLLGEARSEANVRCLRQHLKVVDPRGYRFVYVDDDGYRCRARIETVGRAAFTLHEFEPPCPQHLEYSNPGEVVVQRDVRRALRLAGHQTGPRPLGGEVERPRQAKPKVPWTAPPEAIAGELRRRFGDGAWSALPLGPNTIYARPDRPAVVRPIVWTIDGALTAAETFGDEGDVSVMHVDPYLLVHDSDRDMAWVVDGRSLEIVTWRDTTTALLLPLETKE